MSLIDVTYFDTIYCNLPAGSYDDRASFIPVYEPRILLQMFGYELQELVAAYANPGSTQPIIDLVEGKEYVNDAGETVKWNGLLNSEKESLIAYYVYYWYIRKNTTQTGSSGETKQTLENAINVSSGTKVQDAWNNMERLMTNCYLFLEHHEDDYPTWIFTPLTGSVNSFDL